MQPKILIVGCDQAHLDSVVRTLSADDLQVSATSEPNQIRTVFDKFSPDIVVVSADAPDGVRHSIESLIHECQSSFSVHWQPREGRADSLDETVHAVAKRWLEYNAQ